MDPTKFSASNWGRVRKTPGSAGFYYFAPAPLPRTLNLEPETVMALSDADAALGHLAGAGRQLPQPHLLVGPYLTREALASSRIEGTQASLSEVFQASTAEGEGATEDAREVLNYMRAMTHGLTNTRLPLSMRLVREIHGVLMEGVRGRERSPGEFRTSPNWIGSPDDRPESALFVPPHQDLLPDALSDLERFIHEDVQLPTLIRSALIHYQFETIHPFLDGNGRVGRLLIVFHLVRAGRLPAPLLYISAYFEQRRRDYYDLLQSVRERGTIQDWLRFYLRGVTEQAKDAVARAERLADVRERYRATLSGKTRSRAVEVVDLLLENPVISVRDVKTRLSVTSQGAMNLIGQLESEGWLFPLERRGRGGRRFWVAAEILQVVEAASLETSS